MEDKLDRINSFALDTREDLVINAIEIFDTIKQALVVLDKNLNVVMANTSFYETFHESRKDTEGVHIYDLGNGQWNIDSLRVLLEKVITEKKEVNDYEVAHDFKHIGSKVMLLNAREVIRQDNRQRVILLALEDITAKKLLEKQAEEAEANIKMILENLVGSAQRYSGGTAPRKHEETQK